MKKIGIVNYHYSNHNYGAVLQAAALHNYVNSTLGLQAEHIDYKPPVTVPKWVVKLKNVINGYLMDLGVKEKKITHDAFKNPYIFEEFRSEWLPRSKNCFHSFEVLNRTEFNYTHVIVGSDQVWRPSYTGKSSLVYFLAFLNKNVQKISYAASFGNDSWELPKDETQAIVDEVKTFKAISVRESSGVDICRNTFGIDAEHVLDPTLLVGRVFFDSIIGKESAKCDSGIVYYKLDIDSKFEKYISDVSKKLALPSTNIYYSSYGRAHYYLKVEDWLKEIRDSQIVITDSFHCVCLAILFEKPFLYYPNDNRGVTRLESLLTLLDLQHHIYRDGMDLIELTHRLTMVDYESVKEKLLKLRKSSANFLTNALQS